MVEFRNLSIRIPLATLERLDAAAERANALDLGVTTSRSGWALAAIEAALDVDEAAARHVPAAIQGAMPTRRGSRIVMPRGRIMPKL